MQATTAVPVSATRGRNATAEHRASEPREQPLHAGAPEVAVAGHDHRTHRRGERVRQPPELHRRTVWQPRRQVDAHEVDEGAVDVELHVQRPTERDVVTDRRAESE